MREFSPIAVFLGIVIGALLAAANTFVGLKVGMTISASIPAAVMSLLILKTFLKRGTLLESNMVQTIGSAGQSVAAGMIFTIPAIFIMGENPQYLEMIIWGGIGGLLGVCFMVPLRQVLIVKEHGVLPFPEGVACAEVLQSGERGGAGAKSVIWGSIVGAVYYFVTGLGFWKETGIISLRRFRTEFQVESSPALLGVGYLLGAKIAAYMLAGAILSWFILIPAIGFFGDSSQQAIYPASDMLVGAMSPDDIYKNYVRYIGAGAVAIGGLISLLRSFPTILSSFLHILSGLFRRADGPKQRTDKDLPFPLLILIIGGLAYAMWRFEAVRVDHIGVIAVVLFTFFFVTVSSRLVGIVGSSSNPVSGMTIATLLATALVYRFFVMGDGPELSADELTAMKVACLSVGAIVCIAITIGGDTSQDLKTGFLVKATPYKQQIGEMVGVISSVVVIAAVLLLLNKSYGFTPDRTDPLPAFQANIMKILVEGVLGGNVPWTLIMMGGAAAVIVEMLGLPALPFAVGMYLPLGLSTPIMAGGLVKWWINRKKSEKVEHDTGVLVSSGLVAGMGLMGVTFAGVLALIAWLGGSPQWLNPTTGQTEAVSYAHFVPWIWDGIGFIPPQWGLPDAWWDVLPMFPFALMTIWLLWCARRHPPITLASVPPEPESPPPPSAPADPSGDTDTPSISEKPGTPGSAGLDPFSTGGEREALLSGDIGSDLNSADSEEVPYQDTMGASTADPPSNDTTATQGPGEAESQAASAEEPSDAIERLLRGDDVPVTNDSSTDSSVKPPPYTTPPPKYRAGTPSPDQPSTMEPPFPSTNESPTDTGESPDESDKVNSTDDSREADQTKNTNDSSDRPSPPGDLDNKP